MADFLSDEWFAQLNETLKAAGPVPAGDLATFRIVLEFSDAPTSVPHAMTFTIERDGATVTAGDHLLADTLLRLSYSDALALFRGDIESADALREGRIKVRGDINAIVPLLGWLQATHPQANN